MDGAQPKLQTFYANKPIKSECMMSLEFANNQGTIQNTKNEAPSRGKKPHDAMIREEQHEEISEDESPYRK